MCCSAHTLHLPTSPRWLRPHRRRRGHAHNTWEKARHLQVSSPHLTPLSLPIPRPPTPRTMADGEEQTNTAPTGGFDVPAPDQGHREEGVS